MAEARKLKLYIYNGTSKGDGLSLTKSEIFFLNNRTNVYTEEQESEDPVTHVKTKTVITTTNTLSYEVTLTKLEYRKKVYEPCYILANLQVGLVQERTDVKTDVITTDKEGKTSTDSKTDEGYFKPVEMIGHDKIDLIKGSTVELEIDGNSVAKNYYVHKVRSVYRTVSGKTSLFVELTIFSRDKLMTLDKYSRAYTAKKLYSEILAVESKVLFNSVEVANHMQLLKYQDASTNTTARDELRIPYIVQFNESFYQFMTRAANRYGEFLYFEDGKLNLGMQPSEANYYKKDSNNKDVVIDWATEPHAVQNRYYESVILEEVDVQDRAYDFTGHTPDSGDDYAYAASSVSRYNFDPVATDEWTKQNLKAEEYHEFKEILGEEMKAFIPEFIFKALEMTTLGEALIELGKESAGKIYEVWNTVSDFNRQLDKVNNNVEDDQRSSDYYTQFATYDGSGHLQDNMTNYTKGVIRNFTELFYQTIRWMEKKVGEEAVWLDFGNYYKPIKLGDKLYVEGKDYVTISIEGSYENGQEHLLVSAIPVETLQGSATATSATSSDNQDTWTRTLPIPPALPDVVIRDARPQVAFVAETLDPQNYGRIRVRYPWQDKDGDPSPWIRVTLPMATAGGGVNFTPCVGDEVMVGYEHGNIDRPYAMGYLTAPFVNEKWKDALPLDQYGGIHGIRTKTGHHLTFEDGFAAAPMLFNAIGPLSFVKSLWPVGATGPWPYGNETTADFGGGFELSDRYGFYRIKGSTDDRSVTIESPAGTVEMSAFQGISISAPNGEIEIKGKNVSIEASNELSITSGENIKNKLWYQEKWDSSKKGAIGGLAISAAEDLWDAFKESTYDALVDMSFVRCVVEYFLHPVNGTLQIKSYTFVTIEAGDGEVELPRMSLRKGMKEDENLKKVILTVKLIRQELWAVIMDIRLKYDALYNATQEFIGISGAEGENKNQSVISYSTVVQKGNTMIDEDTDFTLETSDNGGNNLQYEDALEPTEPNRGDDEYKTNGKFDAIKYETARLKYVVEQEMDDIIFERNLRRSCKRRKIKEISERLRVAAYELSEAAKKWTDMKEADFCGFFSAEEVDAEDAVGKIKAQEIKAGTGICTFDKMKNGTYEITIAKPEIEAWQLQYIALSRYIASKYISSKSDIKDNGGITSLDDALDDDKWSDYIDSVEYDDSKSKVSKAGSFLNKHFNPFHGIIDNQNQWAHGFKGKILMSDQADKTASFNDNLEWTSEENEVYHEETIEGIKNMLKKF
jgi:hypothetical protein